MSTRKVMRVIRGVDAVDGAGVKLQRVAGRRDIRDFDPFLMLDAFDSRDPGDYMAGFPWHPHRGIETVTYLIKGEIEHRDSLGNEGVIRDGGCQWMTAGRGIIHREMPKPAVHMLGIQLWINLPQKDKMTAPEYNDIPPGDIVRVEEDGCTVTVISGSYGGRTGPAPNKYVKAAFLDVELAPGKEWAYEMPVENTVFIYIVRGALTTDGQEHGSRLAALYGEGDRVEVVSGGDGVRFLLLSARPLKEPVAWGGPAVMNTEEELDQAILDIEEGTFTGK